MGRAWAPGWEREARAAGRAGGARTAAPAGQTAADPACRRCLRAPPSLAQRPHLHGLDAAPRPPFGQARVAVGRWGVRVGARVQKHAHGVRLAGQHGGVQGQEAVAVAGRHVGTWCAGQAGMRRGVHRGGAWSAQPSDVVGRCTAVRQVHAQLLVLRTSPPLGCTPAATSAATRRLQPFCAAMCSSEQRASGQPACPISGEFTAMDASTPAGGCTGEQARVTRLPREPAAPSWVQCFTSRKSRPADAQGAAALHPPESSSRLAVSSSRQVDVAKCRTAAEA